MTQILLAEDDRISRVMLQAVLQKWGYRVVSVSDGQQALDKLLDPDGPCIAILDWMMPGLTGVDVCRMIHAKDGMRPLHIMLLTARGKGKDTAEALDAGADDYLAKPYNLVELQARIELGVRRLRGRSLESTPSEVSHPEDESASTSRGCGTNWAIALNRIALGVVLEHPQVLEEQTVKAGACDLDLAIQMTLLHARSLLQGRLEVSWEGGPVFVDVASETVSQFLLNVLVFLRSKPGASPLPRATIRSREDGGSVVVSVECDGPDLSAAELDRLAAEPSASIGGPIGFGPWFAKIAIEAAGGAFKVRSHADGGLAVKIRLPRAV